MMSTQQQQQQQQPTAIMTYHQMLFQLVLSYPEKIMELSSFSQEKKEEKEEEEERDDCEMTAMTAYDRVETNSSRQEVSLQILAALAAAAIFEHAQQQKQDENEQPSEQVASLVHTSVESNIVIDTVQFAKRKEEEDLFIATEEMSGNSVIVKNESTTNISTSQEKNTSSGSKDEKLIQWKTKCRSYQQEAQILQKSYQELESKLLDLKLDLALAQATEDTQRAEKEQLIAERDLLLLETENERVAYMVKFRSMEQEREKLLLEIFNNDPAAADDDNRDDVDDNHHHHIVVVDDDYHQHHHVDVKGRNKSKIIHTTSPPPPVEKKRRNFFGIRRRRRNSGKEKRINCPEKEISVIPLHCISDLN